MTENIKHISVVQKAMENGITEPYLASFDNGELVIIKAKSNPEGLIVLFNEYFFYRLATLIDLPMPNSGICLIDKSTKIYNECLSGDYIGYGFYSTNINKAATIVGSIVSLLTNKEDFIKILLFDHIIFNTDRNAGNLLAQYYKNDIKLYAIDHTHALVGQSLWDRNILNRAMAEKDYFSNQILEANQELYNKFYPYLKLSKDKLEPLKSIFRNKINKKSMANILQDIPVEWMPSKQNIDALINYLLYRIEHLDDICVTILKNISERKEIC